MAATRPGTEMPVTPSEPEHCLAQRLERGEILYYSTCPFPLPEGDDRLFLLKQRLGGTHKNISYSPHSGQANGFRRLEEGQGDRLRDLLASFSETATRWLAGLLPRYAAGWKLDMVSFRPEEEATRLLRLTWRNDLLHVDAFPSRPTRGHRILRLFTNVNPAEPRVWVTSDPFPKLLERYGAEAGLPLKMSAWVAWWQRGKFKLFHPRQPNRSVYDEFMLRFHDFLKTNDDFQEHGSKCYWHFPPNCAWLVMTDTASHAALRGRYALEHSYFIAPQTLALPEESPPALLERACGLRVLPQAA